jgi:predicted AAA+ superfamily ATPase
MTFNRLQRAFDLRSVHTAEQYVRFLEEAYLIFQARPFSFKFAESVRRPRKVYTIDNGMTCALSTKVPRDRGALLDNLVFQELRRRGADVFTWTQPDHAVDFLIREDRRVSRLIQVCASLDGEETVGREYRGLRKAAKALRCRDLLILTPDGAPPAERFVPEGPPVKVEALWRWLLG